LRISKPFERPAVVLILFEYEKYMCFPFGVFAVGVVKLSGRKLSMRLKASWLSASRTEILDIFPVIMPMFAWGHFLYQYRISDSGACSDWYFSHLIIGFLFLPTGIILIPRCCNWSAASRVLGISSINQIFNAIYFSVSIFFYLSSKIIWVGLFIGKPPHHPAILRVRQSCRIRLYLIKACP